MRYPSAIGHTCAMAGMFSLLFPVLVTADDSLKPTGKRAESGHVQSAVGSAPREANTTGAPKEPRDYTVAVYYWPNFHRDAYHQSKKGEGWTEWEIVKNGKPKFEGHDQPKVPLWGYRDESDPEEMARSIDAMADAGIGAIIFDWYRYDDDINGGMMIEEALRARFLAGHEPQPAHVCPDVGQSYVH